MGDQSLQAHGVWSNAFSIVIKLHRLALCSLTLEACFKSLNSGLCFRVDADALKTSKAPPITTMPPAFKKQEGKVCADHIEPDCCQDSF